MRHRNGGHEFMRRGRTETSYRANNQLWREGGRERGQREEGKEVDRWRNGVWMGFITKVSTTDPLCQRICLGFLNLIAATPSVHLCPFACLRQAVSPSL